jgi:hypothetical protein
MRILVRLVLVALALAGCSSAASSSSSQPTPAPGSISVLAECMKLYGTGSTVYGVNQGATGPTGWFCVSATGKVVAFTVREMQLACNQQHPGMVVVHLGPNNWQWRCAPPPAAPAA